MPFENWPICKPDLFPPLKYQASSVLGSPLYLVGECKGVSAVTWFKGGVSIIQREHTLGLENEWSCCFSVFILGINEKRVFTFHFNINTAGVQIPYTFRFQK